MGLKISNWKKNMMMMRRRVMEAATTTNTKSEVKVSQRQNTWHWIIILTGWGGCCTNFVTQVPDRGERSD